MYELTLTDQEIRTYPNPHEAYEELRNKLNAKIKLENGNILHYITQTTNTDDGGLKITATYSEERKKHFEANPL